MSDIVTFSLAVFAYALLAASVVSGIAGRRTRAPAIGAATAALAHVGCVWALRFEWSAAEAVEKGVAGAILFHLALLTLVSAALVRPPWALRLGSLAFVIVSAGALGAVFKYDYVAPFRWPVVAVFVGAVASGTLIWRRQRSF
jgi:hypothetical protein